MAIYDPQNAIFVTDMIGMTLKSFKYIQKLQETTPNTEMIFILTHILNGLKMSIYDLKNAIFVTDLIGMALKSFKYMQKLQETTPNTEMIFIYFDPHPKWLKNGHL